MKEELLIKKDENVCKFKALFDFLQAKDLSFLNPIDVTSLVDLKLGTDKLPSIFLWNQVSDPNLGIHDFLKVEDEDIAEFKWVVVDGNLYPIETFCDVEYDPEKTQLLHVMNNAYKIGKTIEYFVAEGLYEGNEGIHFCLIPFNDKISCDVLETLFGSELIKNIQNDLKLEDLDLNRYFDPDGIEYCYSLYIDHFQKTLNIAAILS